MSGRRAWLMVVLVGVLVAVAVFVGLGLVWNAETGDYWCGTVFDRNEVFDAIKERCHNAVNGLLSIEVVIALACGFVATCMTATVLGRQEVSDVPGRDWYGTRPGRTSTSTDVVPR